MRTKQVYVHKSGTEITYEYDYPVYADLDDAKAAGARVEDLNRMTKLDASNVARAEAVAKAGLAPERAPQTPEERELAKRKRQVIARALAKGFSLDEIEELLSK